MHNDNNYDADLHLVSRLHSPQIQLIIRRVQLINIRMGDEALLKPLVDLPRMAEITADMLHRALEAFVKGDVEQARAIPKEDDQVDDLYNQIYRELITFMISDPSFIDRANYLMWAAHNLERMADRVTNICDHDSR